MKRKLTSIVFAVLLPIELIIGSFHIHAEAAALPNAAATMGDMQVTATNSFGAMLADELTEAQQEQLQGNGNSVFSIEMTDNLAAVSFQTVTDCH